MNPALGGSIDIPLGLGGQGMLQGGGGIFEGLGKDGIPGGCTSVSTKA